MTTELALEIGCCICLVIVYVLGYVLGMMQRIKIHKEVKKEMNDFICSTCKHEKWESKLIENKS